VTTFQFTGPDGKNYQVEGPEGATPEQAFGMLQQHMGGQGAQAPAQPVGMGEGLMRAAATGVPILGGLANKAEAATEAALAPVVEPLLPKGMGQRINAPTFKERYENALKIQEEMDKGFAAEHPIASTAAEIAGGVGAFGGAAGIPAGAKALGLTAKTLPGMIGAGAASGGVIGATDAAIRDQNPLLGAALGAGAGAAGPVIGEVAGAIAKPFMRAGTAARTPEIEAAKQVREAFEKDVGKGLKPAEIEAGLQRGQPLAVMDIGGGRATQRLARRAANVSPEAETIFDSTIFGRSRSQNTRTAEYVQDMSEFGDAHEMQQALDKASKAANRVAYGKAMEKGAAGVWNDKLGQLINHPWVKKAIPDALEQSNAEAVLEGSTPIKNPFVTDANGNYSLPKGPDGQTMKPTLEFWDALKKNIDGRIEAAAPSGGGRGDPNTVRMGTNLHKALTGELDDIIPEYRAARSLSAKFFGAKDALQAGRESVTPGTVASRADNRVLRDNIAKMTPDEKKLFRDGVVDQMAQNLLGKPDSQNILNSINQSPKAKERMLMILGKEKYDGLEAYLRVESMMDRFRTAMGNSTTARQLGDMAEGSVTGGLTLSPRRMFEDFFSKAVDKFGRGIDERVATKIAEMLTSGDGKEYMKAVRMISKNKGMMSAFRNPSAAAGAIGVRGAAAGLQGGAQ
jgi:hypothetical protein